MKSYAKGRTMVLGSCFAAGIGERMLAEGCDVCVNPFGTLFNPLSIRSSLDRLRNPVPFTREDCVQMGAGSGLWCSFSHYTKFARPAVEEFLSLANASLEEAAAFYSRCDRLIITFGTAYCFRHKERNMVVSNCLKRPSWEFDRYLAGVDEIASLYGDLDKDVIFTVSPIRHMADGAHGNSISKATLLLATEKIISRDPHRLSYFPAYEILLDELRDYRWYAADGAHPSEMAAELIFDRFEDFTRNLLTFAALC